LPGHATRNGACSLEDISNMLANHAIQSHATNNVAGNSNTDAAESTTADAHSQFVLNEMMQIIPTLQFGMDVNPKFTIGCQGYEFTAELNVLCDMIGCKLVHGWLIDPIQDGPTAAAAGTKTYNELMDRVIAGKEAEVQVSKIQSEIEDLLLQHPQLRNDSITTLDLLDESPEAVALATVHQKLVEQQNDLHEVAMAAHLIEHFLAQSSHQLTQYGLEQLHTTLAENELCVFFRNNHYGTITKHDQQLYLLITDLGYANTPDIVWEKLDVVDGDTEFCNSQFSHNRAAIVQSGSTFTPKQLMAVSSQNDADYHLALHLSMQGNENAAPPSLDEQESQIVAAATKASLHESERLPSNPGTIAAIPGVPTDALIEVGVPVPIRRPVTASVCVPGTDSNVGLTQEAADHMLAMQLQEHHVDVSAADTADAASLRLAQQLQQQEDQRAMAVAPTANAPHQPQRRGRQNALTSASQNCAIM
jgi:MINDY deubiquitinase